MDPDIIVPLAGMLMTVVLALGLPLVVWRIRRESRRDALPQRSPETDERLERIEHAIDAMAVEVERISEGQRFVTRLLSERPADRVALPNGHS